MAGNAVGLGNFLRFPAQAAQNGGGAFLLPYLVSFLLMGIPLLWVEWAIGRHGGQFGHHSTPGMFDKLGKSGWLKYLGVFGLFTNLCIAAYYVYIESWALAYVFHSVLGTFREIAPTAFFNQFVGADSQSIFHFPGQALIWFFLTLGLNVFILSRGLAKGIELAAKIGLPLLVLFAAVLAIRGLTLSSDSPGVVQSPLVGLNFVWEPNLGGLADPKTWLAAAGQVFFTLSVGIGSIHCYAAYLRKGDDIAVNAMAAGWTNEFIEVILGSALLIPIATAYLGLEAVQQSTAGGSGFGLAFMALPTLFNNWGWFGPLAGALWFGLLFFAGITSSLAMGQPILAFLEDEYDWPRKKAAWGFGIASFLLGLVCILFFPGGAFDEFDFWTGTFALVVFALGEAIIFGWIFGIDRAWEEITRGADMKVPRIFRFAIRYIVPTFLMVIFLASLLTPEGGEWRGAFRSLAAGTGWPLAAGSVAGKVLHVGSDYQWFDAAGNPTRDLVLDATRLLLMLVFSGIAFLVYKAWKKKGKSA
ncbi:MAG: sodium-dependent transporter [Acidobacteria bacterium]|nr:sodium-dependent transporter [Acidobacteriota bacterium]